jgi:hypothetical protein
MQLKNALFRGFQGRKAQTKKQKGVAGGAWIIASKFKYIIHFPFLQNCKTGDNQLNKREKENISNRPSNGVSVPSNLISGHFWFWIKGCPLFACLNFIMANLQSFLAHSQNLFEIL